MVQPNRLRSLPIVNWHATMPDSYTMNVQYFVIINKKHRFYNIFKLYIYFIITCFTNYSGIL